MCSAGSRVISRPATLLVHRGKLHRRHRQHQGGRRAIPSLQRPLDTHCHDPRRKWRRALRSEGYLPTNEFAAQLALGLARNAFEQKRWDEAERWYDHVLQHYAQTASAAEALYWKSVCRYKATNDHTWLAKINAGFRDHYRDSLWAEKASIFLEKAA